MSKQGEAKENQGYTRELNNCGNCANFDCDKSIIKFWNGDFEVERNLRCKIGGFKVHKTATCKLHTKYTF